MRKERQWSWSPDEFLLSAFKTSRALRALLPPVVLVEVGGVALQTRVSNYVESVFGNFLCTP